MEGWTINVGYYQQNSHYPECNNDKNWHGFIGDDLIGSIKTILNGCGKAKLDFGNCYKTGTTQVKLDGKVSLVMDSGIRKPIGFSEDPWWKSKWVEGKLSKNFLHFLPEVFPHLMIFHSGMLRKYGKKQENPSSIHF